LDGLIYTFKPDYTR